MMNISMPQVSNLEINEDFISSCSLEELKNAVTSENCNMIISCKCKDYTFSKSLMEFVILKKRDDSELLPMVKHIVGLGAKVNDEIIKSFFYCSRTDLMEYLLPIYLKSKPIPHELFVNSISYCELDQLKLLVRFGFNPFAKTEGGETALHFAVNTIPTSAVERRFSQEEIDSLREFEVSKIKYLLSLGLSFDDEDINGVTPRNIINKQNIPQMLRLL